MLQRFAAEAWRRNDAGEVLDEEMYPCAAAWAGIYDRFGVTTAGENERRIEIATRSGPPAATFQRIQRLSMSRVLPKKTASARTLLRRTSRMGRSVAASAISA